MNIRIGALLSALVLATSLACGGSAKKPAEPNQTGGNVTISFTTESLSAAADSLDVLVDGVSVGTFTQPASTVFGFNGGAPIKLNIAAGTHTIELRVYNFATPAVIIASGIGTVVVPADNTAVVAKIKVNSAANQAPPVNKGFIITSFSATNSPTLSQTFAVGALFAPGNTPKVKWARDAGCTGTWWSTDAVPVNLGTGASPAAAAPYTLDANGYVVQPLLAVTFVADAACIGQFTANLRDPLDTLSGTVPNQKGSLDQARSAMIGFGGVNVGITTGEIIPPVITSVKFFDEAAGLTCTMNRGNPKSYPAVPAGCDGASTTAAALVIGDLTFNVAAGQGARFPAAGIVAIGSGASFETAQFTRAVDTFTLSAGVAKAHASGAAVAFYGILPATTAAAAGVGAPSLTTVTLLAGEAARFSPVGSLTVDDGTPDNAEVFPVVSVTGDVFTVDPGFVWTKAHAAGAMVTANYVCEFAKINPVVGNDVCVPNPSTTFPFVGATETMVVFVGYDLKGSYDKSYPPVVSIDDGTCSGEAPFPGGSGLGGSTPSSGAGALSYDPVQWYQTSANTDLLGAYVGTADLAWRQPAGPPPANPPVACTLTATINNQGVVDTFPIFLFMQ